jgi:hypothetical protein
MAKILIKTIAEERQNYDSICRAVRGFSLYGPAYIGIALPFVYAATGAIGRLDEGALASVIGAATGGLVGLVFGTVIAVGGTILGGLADADTGADD